MDFFTSTDFQRFVTNSGRPYDANNPSHQQLRENLLNGVIRKTTHWGELVCQRLGSMGYSLTQKHNQVIELDRKTKIQVFRKYTWASLAQSTANGDNIYFTVGINQGGNFLVKLDYQRHDQPGRDANQNLAPEIRNLLSDFITTRLGEEAGGIELKRTELGRYNWHTLTEWAAYFIHKYTPLYEEALRIIGAGGVPPAWSGTPMTTEQLTQRRAAYMLEAQLIDPADDHYQMSVALHQQLQMLCGAANVAVESPTGYRTRMDLEVRNPSNDSRLLFELKSGSDPTMLRPAIREALGQLLEYAYWPEKPALIRALIIATPNPVTEEAKRFLARLVLPDGAKLAYLQVQPGIGADVDQLRRLLRRYEFIA
jgi:hypothetical protein